MAPLLPQHQQEPQRQGDGDEERLRRYNDEFELESDSEDDESYPMKPVPKAEAFLASSHRRDDTDSQRPRRRRNARRMLSQPWLVFVLGFLTALIPSAIIVRHPGLFFQDQSQAPPSQPAAAATTSVPSAAASAKTVNTTFSAFPHHDLNLTASEAWDKLYSPPNQGMLYLQDPASDNPDSHNVLGVSMFHALHCLGMIRNLVTNSTANTASEPAHGAHGQAGVDDGVGDDSHISHCFFYIAQTLTCGADGTLEPPSPVFDASGFFVVDHAVDGNGHKHVCRDSSMLWDVALKSQEQPVKDWGWQEGDSVQTVFAESNA